MADWGLSPPNYLLQDAFRHEPPTAIEPSPLVGRTGADVCIVGGGYVGLWTAIRIKERDPAVDVVLVERGLCGAGASGRNGGFALSWWPKFDSLCKVCGPADALALVHQSQDAIRELMRFCRRTGIDAQVREEGWLWAATNERQLEAWAGTVAAAASQGESPFRVLDRQQAQAMAGTPSHIGGVWEECAATVQPALLARGLPRRRRAVGRTDLRAHGDDRIGARSDAGREGRRR